MQMQMQMHWPYTLWSLSNYCNNPRWYQRVLCAAFLLHRCISIPIGSTLLTVWKSLHATNAFYQFKPNAILIALFVYEQDREEKNLTTHDAFFIADFQIGSSLDNKLNQKRPKCSIVLLWAIFNGLLHCWQFVVVVSFYRSMKVPQLKTGPPNWLKMGEKWSAYLSSFCLGAARKRKSTIIIVIFRWPIFNGHF